MGCSHLALVGWEYHSHKIFASYCNNIYLCYLWINFRLSALKSNTIAYNNAFRILLVFSRRCSAIVGGGGTGGTISNS